MDDTLNRSQTTESVFLPISREAFEKLYLSPKNPHVSSDLRKKVGNPTPISLLGFLIASTSNACIMMGWRGSGGEGAAIMYVGSIPGVNVNVNVNGMLVLVFVPC